MILLRGRQRCDGRAAKGECVQKDWNQNGRRGHEEKGVSSHDRVRIVPRPYGRLRIARVGRMIRDRRDRLNAP
jgi:hypothetical protein